MYTQLNRMKNSAAKKRIPVNIVFLGDFEKKIYSQHGEDGVLEKIFELIGTDSKYYVDLGVQDGNTSNTLYL